jgi:phage shock protein PspC (stress-responsive transcriptional regulator)
MTSAPPPAPPPAPPSLDPPYYGPPPPPPPPPPPFRGQLRRSRTDKVIGGVAGGLARYSGIDPLLWRVGFVALAFAGGTGVLVYLLLWLLMPATPVSADGYAFAPVAVEPKAPVGPRSPVPGVTVAAVLIAMGVLALLNRLTDWTPGPRVFLGTALLVVGLGLAVAAFVGGRSAKGGLIALGAVLSLALLFASTAPWRGMHGDFGDRTWVATTADAVRPAYHAGVGDIRLDLSGVDVSNLDGPIHTSFDGGIGDVTILLPEDADVRLAVDSGLGDVTIGLGEDNGDGMYPGEGSGDWVGDGQPEIVLDVDAGLGDVEVSRA